MQHLIIKPWRRSQSLCCRKNIQKHEKIANNFKKKIAQISDIKILKNIHYNYKLCSNILSNPSGSSEALEAEETWKMTIFKKLEKKLQVLQKNC